MLMLKSISIVTGRVLESGTGQPIFDAKIRHLQSRRSTNSDEHGAFKIQIPNRQAVLTTKLIFLADGYWPRITKFDIRRNSEDLPENLPEDRTSLRPFKAEGPWIWKLLASMLPALLNWWLGVTARERVLTLCVIIFLFFPALIFAIGQGLDVPFTDVDEFVRERLQMLGLPLWKIAPVRYHYVKSRYHSGVTYIIPAGKYDVDQDVVIEGRRPAIDGTQGSDESLSKQTATVQIEKGTRLSFSSRAGILCYGTLEAKGGSREDERITFQSSPPAQRWANITIWGRTTRNTRYDNTDFISHGGRRMRDAIETETMLAPDGQLRGGALTVYDTTITVTECTFRDCQAEFGGAVYMRNAPITQQGSFPPPPGSDFSHVRMAQCKAISRPPKQMTGGGAVFLKQCSPQFTDCIFSGNQVQGPSSCGGALYVGLRARVAISHSEFLDNRAIAGEVGGIYAVKCDDSGPDYIYVVVLNTCAFLGNEAQGSGGAIAASNARVSIVRCSFENNVANPLYYERDKKYCARGGAVNIEWTEPYSPQVSTRIEESSFTGNRVSAEGSEGAANGSFVGGALHYEFTTATRFEALVTKQIQFDSNKAPKGCHVAASKESKRIAWTGKCDNETRFSSPGRDDARAEEYYGQSPKAYSGKAPRPQIQDDLDIGRGYYDARPNGRAINTIVLYLLPLDELDLPPSLTQVGKSLQRHYGNMRSKLSVHYVVLPTGSIHRLVPDDSRAWYSDHMCFPDGAENVDDCSIGIVLVVPEVSGCSTQQIDTLASLLCDLRRSHPEIGTERIFEASYLRYLWKCKNSQIETLDAAIPLQWSTLVSRLEEDGFE